MMYHVGDRVVVSPCLLAGCMYPMADGGHRVQFVHSMTEYSGQVVTIAKIEDNSGHWYRIREDFGLFSWTDTMFTGLESEARDENIDPVDMDSLFCV